ncbi:MAG TPA: M4 family metallopeptidase, partial [Polyangiaceae bacterium]|nr:M4 family metallopeptidase [Polyangiaceae bacterium]
MAACSGRLVEGDETSADPAGNPDAGAAGPAGDPDAGTADPPAGPNPPAPAVDTGRLAPDVRRALANLPAAEVVAEGHQGLAAFVRGNLGKVAVSTAGVLDRDLKQALEPIAPVFRLDAVDLHATKISVDELGQTHVRLRQTRNGLDVIGGDLRLHIDKDGTIAVVNGTAHGVIDGPPPVPTVAPADATVAALAFSGNGSLSAYPPSLTYAIVNSTGELHLTWDVRVEGVNGRGVLLDTRVLVDAHTGQVVDNLPLLLSGRSRTLSTADGTDAIPGRFLFGESGPLDYSNLPANDNHWWLGNVYDAYRAIYGRDSYDFAGATLDSTIDYVTTAGVRNNAFWHGMYHRLLFGPGDGVNYGNFAASGDVVAHEFTHAVTGSESALTYAGESGALNEAMSDMFAAILAEYNRGYIDQGTFWIAEDIHQPNEPGEHAMRYMDDPTRDGYSRDHYATRREPGFCLPDEQNDWCGVHGNSGIANLAFYLMVVGGNRSGVTVTGVGMAKARQIVYRANTRYLTSSATFTTMRAACLQASRDLYDATTAERVGRAWDAVGVWSAEPNDNFSAATNIASLPFTIFGNTYHASQEEGEAGFGSSVWFKWTPTRSGTVGFNLIADGVTPLLYVMTGTKLDYSLNTVTKSDPRVNVVAGSTYRIQIHNEPWETTGFRFEGDYVQDAIVYVSDLSWKSATNGFGPVERDRSNGQAAAGDGKVLTLGGTTYSKGLGVHGASDVRFDLAGKYARFLASVGVDDEVGA